jgi:hypothetical protein
MIHAHCIAPGSGQPQHTCASLTMHTAPCLLPHTTAGRTQAGEAQPRRVTFDAAAPSTLAPAATDLADTATPQPLGSSSGGGGLQGNNTPAQTEGGGFEAHIMHDAPTCALVHRKHCFASGGDQLRGHHLPAS